MDPYAITPDDWRAAVICGIWIPLLPGNNCTAGLGAHHRSGAVVCLRHGSRRLPSGQASVMLAQHVAAAAPALADLARRQESIFEEVASSAFGFADERGDRG